MSPIKSCVAAGGSRGRGSRRCGRAFGGGRCGGLDYAPGILTHSLMDTQITPGLPEVTVVCAPHGVVIEMARAEGTEKE